MNSWTSLPCSLCIYWERWKSERARTIPHPPSPRLNQLPSPPAFCDGMFLCIWIPNMVVFVNILFQSRWIICSVAAELQVKSLYLLCLLQRRAQDKFLSAFWMCCNGWWSGVSTVSLCMLGNIWRAYGLQHNLWLWHSQYQWPSLSPVKTLCARYLKYAHHHSDCYQCQSLNTFIGSAFKTLVRFQLDWNLQIPAAISVFSMWAKQRKRVKWTERLANDAISLSIKTIFLCWYQYY